MIEEGLISILRPIYFYTTYVHAIERVNFVFSGYSFVQPYPGLLTKHNLTTEKSRN